jgi:excisionase family DNA binding protein
MSNIGPLLSPAQAAERLGYTREWLHKAYLRTGIIPSFTIGRKRKIEADAVERFIERQRAQTEWNALGSRERK